MKEEKKPSGKTPSRGAETGKCENCEFFEDDEEFGPTCSVGLDEDEFADFLAKQTGKCPYFRYYDEYKTVRKQN